MPRKNDTRTKTEIIFKGAPSIEEFLNKYSSDEKVFKYILKYLYPCGEVVCANCGCTERVYGRRKKLKFNQYICGHCGATVIPTNGTIFEGSGHNLRNNFKIFYYCFTARKGISTRELARNTGMCDVTIYNFRRRMQLAMSNFDFKPFSGDVQMDECFLGLSNHGRFSKESGSLNPNATAYKFPVIGIYGDVDEKGNGRVYSYPAIPDEDGKLLTGQRLKYFIECTCLPGTIITTDEWRGYNVLDKPDSKFLHQDVNHNDHQWSNEEGFTTNGIEGYWSLVKKCYYGAHSNFNPGYAHLYLSEFDCRYRHQDSWDDYLDEILTQATIIPRVIDIRQMGKFGNKTYKLSDYRMILPKCFDDIDIKDITVDDILNCEEPVYGILRTPYKTKRSQGCHRNNYPKEWQDLGMVKGFRKYKDYRETIVNTASDVEDMLKDADKYKVVNKYEQFNLKPYSEWNHDMLRKKSRRFTVRQKYNNLDPILKAIVRAEYPNILITSDKEKTTKIHKRINELMKWYEKQEIFDKPNKETT